MFQGTTNDGTEYCYEYLETTTVKYQGTTYIAKYHPTLGNEMHMYDIIIFGPSGLLASCQYTAEQFDYVVNPDIGYDDGPPVLSVPDQVRKYFKAAYECDCGAKCPGVVGCCC